MNTSPRLVVAAALLLTLPGAARSQTGYFADWEKGLKIAAGVAAVALVGAAIYYSVREKPTITGCVQTVDGTITLISERTKRRYTLVGAPLSTGERLTLKGSSIKAKDGSLTFRVDRAIHDFGPCSPQA